MASSTRRRTRAAGKRRMPSQSRRHTGRRRPTRRSRTHGFTRGRSWASWRRRTITVRRSCTVTAKRSWPTRLVRRSANSTETPPIARSPTTNSTPTATAPSRSIQCTRSGQMAMLPIVVVGAGTISARSSAAHVMTSAPRSVAAGDGSRPPDAHSAAPTKSTAIRTPAAAQLAIHASGAPGSLRTTSCPATAPTTAPTKQAKRRLRSTGPRSAPRRSTGARSTNRTSAGSRAMGPPRLPDRNPAASASAAMRPTAAGPCSRTLAIPLAVSSLSPTRLDRNSTTTVPTMPATYAWYAASSQSTSAMRLRRRVRRRSRMACIVWSRVVTAGRR